MKSTDETGRKLKDDAHAIDVDVTPALRTRIDAAIATTSRARTPARRPRALSPATWGAVAAGLAAVSLVVVLQNRELQPAHTPPAVADTPLVLPEPLEFERVEFTGPLQQELESLRADLEKARDSIERDLRDSL